MSVSVSTTNKPLNPRAQDLSPKGYNRAALYSGKALDFDGVNDVVTISDNAAVDFGTSDFSIAFTMNSSVAGFGRVLDKRSGTNGYTLSIGTSKELVLELNDGTGSSGFSTSSIYADGKLKHVVVSADRDGNASFYVNGVFDEAFDISSKSGNLDSTSDLFIGADAPSGNSLYYNGSIAGLKMYSTALTAAQVADLYLNPEKIVPDGVADSALKLWLPMMEGAGTTAYDGSGNGNHGTINGATWVSGIGAPVAQTALVSWNKGTNNLIKTDDYTNATYWTRASCTPTSSSIRVPNADEDSVLITETATTGTHGIYNNGGSTIATNDTYTMSVFAKAGTRNWLIIDHYTATTNYTWFDLSTGSVGTTGSGVTASIRDAGDGWYQCSVTRTTTSTVSIYIGVYLSTGDGVSSYLGASGTAYFYGLSITQGSNATYVPNPTTTSITSEVLLPQGLTANKDITGVNAFESARNPYALNLDGASWGEVHDNASLDFGTGSFTLEAWVKAKYVNQGSGVNAALSLGGDGAAYSAMFVKSNNVFSFYYNGFFINSSAQTEGDWVHIVGTYDETNQTLYIDGLQVAQNARGAADITNALVKQIGRDTNANRFYQDQIAQPRIYNRALTATEVLRNYNADKSKFGL
jgi:hypothetical protein